ncbi:MAG: SDR family oxidoreductase [Rhodothermales bacterium]|nr:SDR family oxidoreductase [Rhodothermales bacterium]
MDLAASTIVVTGASAGLGRRFSRDLVAAGARVFGLARRTGRLDALAEELGDAFTGIECDVADETSVDNAFERIVEESGQVNALINNAGFGRFGPIDEMSARDFDLLMKVNVRGVFLCSRRVVPVMRRQNDQSGFGGHIVNIASIAGLIGNPEIGAYNASKFGVRGLSESMFKELRGDGIKVTCLFPGSIETEFFDRADASMTSNPLTPEHISSTLVHVLETPENYLISEIVMRPLRPKG